MDYNGPGASRRRKAEGTEMDRKRCEIICVGTELLLGDVLNTNAQYLAQGLSRLGLDLYVQTVVGDNLERMKQAIKAAMGRAEILLFTGGLGPTSDDLTREAVAACFGRELRHDPEALAEIRGYYALTRRPMPPSNEKQALLPEGGILLKNPQGTAPGCIVFDDDGHTAVLMPGPPREMRPMFDNLVVPFLRQFSGSVLLSRVVRVVSLGESRMEEMLADLIRDGVNPTLAPYAREGEAMVRVTARAKTREEALELTEPAVRETLARLGRHAYGVDVPDLETVVAELLARAGYKASFLEAGGGGLAALRLQSARGGAAVCGPCLSAPSMDALTALAAPGETLPESPADACALLAEKAKAALGTEVCLVTALSGTQAACAVSLPGETRRYAQTLPSRGADYYRVAAAQAAFDLLRLSLLDRLEGAGAEKAKAGGNAAG